MNTAREPAALLLEDGTRFVGQAFGASGQTTGEVVFNTSMTGYQEILTDPSYRAQLVTMTYPHIGNTGVNPADVESERVQAAGLIVREAHEAPSSWRSSGSLHRYLERNGVIALTGIDTRALVRRLRQTGAMRGALVTGDLSPERLREVLATEPPMEGRDLASEVSCKAPYDFTEGLLRLHGEARTRPVPPRPARPYRVVAYDFGIKRNILRLLVDSGCEVTVVPAKTSAEDVLARDPDGIFLSNGPGDPAACIEAIANVRALIGKRPIFGICLGHQILALALGARTYKLKFGHRGGNQPVRDEVTGRIEITSQNHGFAVDLTTLPQELLPTHVNLNDGTNEGLAHRDLPIFSVQYHPEASPGPHDADYLFARFRAAMDAAR
ncbi:MAG: carbamoyl-phosphate synthase small subunit [Myxococcales bacterium]|nr:carbamoyl-phosphate synthase small subunit [Myxococcales bacterium]